MFHQIIPLIKELGEINGIYEYGYVYIYICNIMGVVVATRLRFQVLPPWNCLCFTLYSIVCLEICRFRHVK